MNTGDVVAERFVVEARGGSGAMGAVWRATLPVGGVDGTLKNRFAATPLQGAIFAKTGSLNASNALSGFLRAASGQELIFSIYANDVPDGVSALPALDRAVQLIAAQN